MKSGLFLDVVVLKSAAIFELLTGKDKSLLVWGNTFLVLDLSLDGLDGVGLLDFERDSFTGEGLNENLHVKLLKIYYNLTIKRSLYSRIILKFINRPIKLSKLTR